MTVNVMDHKGCALPGITTFSMGIPTILMDISRGGSRVTLPPVWGGGYNTPFIRVPTVPPGAGTCVDRLVGKFGGVRTKPGVIYLCMARGRHLMYGRVESQCFRASLDFGSGGLFFRMVIISGFYVLLSPVALRLVFMWLFV